MTVKNQFKDHSVSAIEQCLGKALSELLGKEVNVVIEDMKLSSESSVISKGVTLSLKASHEGWLPDSMR